MNLVGGLCCFNFATFKGNAVFPAGLQDVVFAFCFDQAVCYKCFGKPLDKVLRGEVFGNFNALNQAVFAVANQNLRFFVKTRSSQNSGDFSAVLIYAIKIHFEGGLSVITFGSNALVIKFLRFVFLNRSVKSVNVTLEVIFIIFQAERHCNGAGALLGIFKPEICLNFCTTGRHNER